MKKFSVFWESISEDDFVKIANDVNKQVDKMREETEDPKNILGNQIAIMNTLFTYEILSRYHSWLSEQLGLPLED